MQPLKGPPLNLYWTYQVCTHFALLSYLSGPPLAFYCTSKFNNVQSFSTRLAPLLHLPAYLRSAKWVPRSVEEVHFGLSNICYTCTVCTRSVLLKLHLDCLVYQKGSTPRYKCTPVLALGSYLMDHRSALCTKKVGAVPSIFLILVDDKEPIPDTGESKCYCKQIQRWHLGYQGCLSDAMILVNSCFQLVEIRSELWYTANMREVPGSNPGFAI